MSINGTTLRFASDDLKNNKEIVKLAIINRNYVLEFASDNIRENKEFVKEMMINYNCGL